MQLTVDLGERCYPIKIAANLFSSPESFGLKSGQRVFIITNETIAPLYLDQITATLNQVPCQIDTLILPDGEQYKSMSMLNLIFTELLQRNHGRDTTILALGGGVIGDISGFAAACYQRGVPFIQVPTTLLSQVDSSVGGKTAVNHPLGKNMIGAFYQPKSVVIDIDCLKTLPAREFSAGLAEVIKYGIIFDYDFFVWLENHIEKLLQLDETALVYCISTCCKLKATVVKADEKEQNVRALLNLGHTFGHAIETEMGYGNWLHGEAVSVGMLMAAHTAHLLGKLSLADVNRIQQLLQRANLPIVRPATMPVEAYLPHMMRDKKVLQGQLRLVIPTAIGQSEVDSCISHEIVNAAILACE